MAKRQAKRAASRASIVDDLLAEVVSLRESISLLTKAMDETNSDLTYELRNLPDAIRRAMSEGNER